MVFPTSPPVFSLRHESPRLPLPQLLLFLLFLQGCVGGFPGAFESFQGGCLQRSLGGAAGVGGLPGPLPGPFVAYVSRPSTLENSLGYIPCPFVTPGYSVPLAIGKSRTPHIFALLLLLLLLFFSFFLIFFWWVHPPSPPLSFHAGHSIFFLVVAGWEEEAGGSPLLTHFSLRVLISSFTVSEGTGGGRGR